MTGNYKASESIFRSFCYASGTTNLLSGKTVALGAISGEVLYVAPLAGARQRWLLHNLYV